MDVDSSAHPINKLDQLADQMTPRLLFDISTSLRWVGPPVGIVRVERELAKWAMNNDPNCRFVFFDANLQTYREVHQTHLNAVLNGSVTLETTGMKSPSDIRIHKTDRVPRVLLEPFLWLTQFRRMALRTTGGLMLRTRLPKLQTVLTFLHNLFAGKKYRAILASNNGSRHVFAPLNVLVGDTITLEKGDKILFAGANWAYSNVAYIKEQKKLLAIDLITICYDLIPLQSPHFFRPHDVAILRRHFDMALVISSIILVTSDVIGRDVRTYCLQNNMPAQSVLKIPLGLDLPKRDDALFVAAQLPHYSRYILFVSTIEPRKGHQLVQKVWNRLLQEEIPQRLDTALFLVGRTGWLLDDLTRILRTTDRLQILENVSDRELHGLYTKADFCIYPSQYEGYGLPVVEALGRKKPVLAANVGIVPELHTSLLKRVPANDEDAWYEAIKAWLEKPPDLGDAHFEHPTWQEAAAESFASIRYGDLNNEITSKTPRSG